MKKTTEWNDIANVIICLFVAVILFVVFSFFVPIPFPDDDGEWNEQLATECIAKKIEKGYPKDFAKEYCKNISWGCARGRIYEENCNPEVKCCFVTIEEDKKWNYLDYDENGNKIEK